MTTTEAVKLALEALENAEYGDYDKKELNKAITALREALASEAIEQKSGIKQVIELYDSPDQPSPATPLREQEPVAMRYDFDGYGWKYIDSGSGSDWQTRIKDAEPVYTSPPAQPAQRTWVGLTAEERNTICENAGTWREAMKVIEAKLKAKNSL